MLPLLHFAGDEREHSLREAIEVLAGEFRLTEEEQKELLPSGRQPTFDNRVGWARTYMKKAGLLETPRRGYFRIAAGEKPSRDCGSTATRNLVQTPNFGLQHSLQ